MRLHLLIDGERDHCFRVLDQIIQAHASGRQFGNMSINAGGVIGKLHITEDYQVFFTDEWEIIHEISRHPVWNRVYYAGDKAAMERDSIFIRMALPEVRPHTGLTAQITKVLPFMSQVSFRL